MNNTNIQIQPMPRPMWRITVIRTNAYNKAGDFKDVDVNPFEAGLVAHIMVSTGKWKVEQLPDFIPSLERLGATGNRELA